SDADGRGPEGKEDPYLDFPGHRPKILDPISFLLSGEVSKMPKSSSVLLPKTGIKPINRL
ncbi:MAG: hypothetical protein V3V56_05755, partial [bacterium]